MGKNILVLTGSPRTGGNSEMLTSAFVRGVETTEHTVTVFHAGKKKIQGCRACNKCYSKGKACVFNDDFNELAPLLEEADMLVLITPLYWFTFPAQIKAAIDKIYALAIGGKEIKIRESMLMVCAETDAMTDFDGIVKTFDIINQYMQWEGKEPFLVPNVNHLGDILQTDALQAAEELGSAI